MREANALSPSRNRFWIWILCCLWLLLILLLLWICPFHTPCHQPWFDLFWTSPSLFKSLDIETLHQHFLFNQMVWKVFGWFKDSKYNPLFSIDLWGSRATYTTPLTAPYMNQICCTSVHILLFHRASLSLSTLFYFTQHSDKAAPYFSERVDLFVNRWQSNSTSPHPYAP